MKEIWKVIEGTNGSYKISNLGRVYTFKSKRIMKQTSMRSGHLCVGLMINGKQKIEYIHQLVGKAFIDNPNNYIVVHHIDNNPKNNRVDNLMWTTRKINTQYAAELGLIGRKKTIVTEEQLKGIGKLLLEKKLNYIKIGKIFNLPTHIIGEINLEFSKVDDKFKRSASKLGTKEKNEIKNLLIQGDLNQYEIADLYSVKQPTIFYIKKKFGL